jgi:hypothetical protein
MKQANVFAFQVFSTRGYFGSYFAAYISKYLSKNISKKGE